MYATIGYERQQFAKPYLAIVPDIHNNVGRYCSYKKSERIWRIMTPLRDMNSFTRYYLIQNQETGERVITSVDRMHYMY